MRCCLQLFHRLICYSSPPSSVSCLLLPVSLLSCLLHISLYTVLPSQSWPPCSRNSAAPFGSLSSAILSTCPAHVMLFTKCNTLTTEYCITLYFRGKKISRKVNLKYFREKIFSRIYCSRENIFPRKFLPAKISSREKKCQRFFFRVANM